MNKKKILTGLGISAGILTLSAVLLVGNTHSAFSDTITGKSSKYSEKQYTVKESAIKTYAIDTNREKPVFSRDVFDNDIATESSDIRTKMSAALVVLTQENIFKVGDLEPMFFLEGKDKVSIAIQHPDGTISLDKFDISKDKPAKIDHKVKEAK